VLASSPFARRLKTLDVSDNALGDAGLAAMIGATHLSGLRVLRLARNGIGAAGSMLLGGAPPDLGVLDLSANPLGPAGAAALALVVPRLELASIDVSGCGIGDEALAQILAGSPSLERLGAAESGVSPALVAHLSSVGPGRLQEVDLSGNGLPADSLLDLAALPALRGVRSLELRACALGAADPRQLCEALERLPALERLDLADNGLRSAFASALSTSLLVRRLASLDLSSNLLGDGGAEALGAVTWPLLRDLRLGQNDLSLAGVVRVSASRGMALLHRLAIPGNAVAGQADMYTLSQQTAAVLEASFARLASLGGDFGERFYAALFARYPGIAPLFAQTSMKRQYQHLLSTLALVIEHLRHPDAAQAHLESLAERHLGYGVSPSHYHAVVSILLETMRQTLGEEWTPEVENAWHDGLEAIVTTMLGAHRRGRVTAAPA
jgi:hemoglobin-like flavoprotein/Ran GTPase-activating protein (RanGAP) involved in mRNA processing and transport